MGILRSIGSVSTKRLNSAADVLNTMAWTLNSVMRHHRHGRRVTMSVLMRQLYFSCFEALPLISWIALILGLVIVTQILNILPQVGGEALIGDILVWIIVREAGPVLAAVIVIARSGTAIASELGSMKINRELSALEMMGIAPAHYLIMPRVIGTCLSVVILTFYFEVAAILGGYLLAGFGTSITFSAYAASVLESMTFFDVFASLLKSLLFGLVIGSTCSYYGLTVEKSITQIPQKTTKAVISSLLSVFLIDGVITFIFYM